MTNDTKRHCLMGLAIAFGPFLLLAWIMAGVKFLVFLDKWVGR